MWFVNIHFFFLNDKKLLGDFQKIFLFRSYENMLWMPVLVEFKKNESRKSISLCLAFSSTFTKSKCCALRSKWKKSVLWPAGWLKKSVLCSPLVFFFLRPFYSRCCGFCFVHNCYWLPFFHFRKSDRNPWSVNTKMPVPWRIFRSNF